jgi:hypothetical protein
LPLPAINAAVFVPVLLVTPSLRDRQLPPVSGQFWPGWWLDGSIKLQHKY